MAVPSFFIYGEPEKPLDIGFMHVETVMERKQVHFGQVSAHKHEKMAQITFWTRGHGTYFIEDERLDFIAPAVSFVPSGAVHGFTVAPEVSDALVVSVADSALPPVQALSSLDFGRPLMVRSQPDNPVWPRLQAVMERLHADYREGRSAALAALFAVASSDIASLARSDATGKAHGGKDLSHALRNLVDRQFRQNWRVEQYIAALGTTPHLLDKACRDMFGMPVKAFIDERRLLEAKRLLLFTVRSVEDIAFEIGFQDPAYFSRFFRRRTGQPPGEWRGTQQDRPA